MERETKEIITPLDKHKVVLKTYITTREERDIRNVFLKEMELEMEGTVQKSNKINALKLTEDAENKAIEIVVVSIDGKTEKIMETILDMKSKDGAFVVAEINKVTKDDFLDKSQKPKDITE